MESIYESEHRMDPETIFKVGNDVGIDEHQVVNNPMLRKIAATFNVDLDGYYQKFYLNKEKSSNPLTQTNINSNHVIEYEDYYGENLYKTASTSFEYSSSRTAQKEPATQPVLDLKALGFLN